MRKFSYALVVVCLIGISACANQAGPVETPAAPTSTPPPTEEPTAPPPPTELPTETSLPDITSAATYPLIISAHDPFNQVVAVDPGDAQRIVHCAAGEIRVSHDAGETWESISTAGVAAAAGEHGYELFYGEPGGEDACLSAALDPEHSSTYYTIFTAAHEEYGAPPVFYMGFFTADGGETWQFVEPPEGATVEDFGGFWNLGTGGVQAAFFPAGYWEKSPDEFLITETSDGGLEWQRGELSCPAAGACLRWGPAPASIPGMGSPLPQLIFHSPDGGETWNVIDPPVELRTPAPNQLVFLSDAQVLIISGSIHISTDAPAVRISNDMGASWQPLDLPQLSAEEISADSYPGLQYLANQTYLSQAPEDSTWYWLQPEMPIWCPVNTDRLPQFPVLLQSVGDLVWWVDPAAQQARHVSLSEFTCAVE